MTIDGIVFADELPPELVVVDLAIDRDGWVIEYENATLAPIDRYPIWLAGEDIGEFIMAMANGPGAYNACVAQAQANCPGKVCWVALVGPSQACVWNCQKPCKPKPPLTFGDVCEFVMD